MPGRARFELVTDVEPVGEQGEARRRLEVGGVELGAVENGSDQRMTQALERQLLDWLVREGRIAEVERMIGDLVSNRKEGDAR